MKDNTLWYTITSTTGNKMINFSKVTRVQKSGGTGIGIYAGDVAPGFLNYNFNTTAERDDTYDKIERILNAVNISKLPPQTD